MPRTYGSLGYGDGKYGQSTGFVAYATAIPTITVNVTFGRAKGGWGTATATSAGTCYGVIPWDDLSAVSGHTWTELPASGLSP